MTVTILQGDCREVLKTLAAGSVHCCVTSPPYFGLRDYGVPASIWGGDDACDHEWGDLIQVNATNHTDKRRWQHTRNGRDEEQPTEKRVAWLRTEVPQGKFCQKCNAWTGAHGLEPTPDLFVEHEVMVFREVHRVLRDDGTFWLNLGDSYAGSWGAQGRRETESDKPTWHSSSIANHPKRASNTGSIRQAGLKSKDLIGIPWMVAFALRADGWYLRSDIIWAKKNCMPESVTDRPSSAHEHVFLLSKQPRYFYDAEAIREAETMKPQSRLTPREANPDAKVHGQPFHRRPEGGTGGGTRNSRNVWSIATQPFADAHFATFPPELAERCIKAGSSERGCCSACGAPWVRQIERKTRFESGSGKAGNKPNGKGAGGPQTESGSYDVRMGPVIDTVTTGWKASCSCNADIVPCTVCDPFGGAGTTGVVADRLGRNAILIELNPEYADMAEKRIRLDIGTEKGMQGRSMMLPGLS